MLESLFNRADGLKAYNIIRKRLQHRCFCILWILRNSQEGFFAEDLLTTTSEMTLFFFFFSFLQINELCSLKKFIWLANATLDKGIHNPFQFCVVMKISRELHLPSGYYDLLKGKEDNLWRALLSFVKITNFNMTRFFTRNNKLKYCEILRTPILKNI